METNLFTNLGTQSSGSGSNPASNGLSPDKDMFTKLLVAQIRNQDPLSPQDPSQFVQQLTQLAQTEAMQKLGDLTTINGSVLQSMQAMALGAQVGSDVTVLSDQVQLDKTKVSGQFTLTSNSTKTTVVLTGIDGNEHKVELGTRSSGPVSFAIDPVALGLPEGTYKIKVVTNTNETPDVGITGRVNGVRMPGDGSIFMNVANVGEVAPAALTAFNGKSASSNPSVL